MSLVRMRDRGGMNVVSSSWDVSPGRILTTVLVVVVNMGYIRANGIGVIELLHERTAPGVGVGNLMMLVPGVMNNRIIVRVVKDVSNRLKVNRRFEVRRGAVVGHVVWGRSAGS